MRMDVTMRVLIAGCGYVGTALGVALAHRGETVFGLRRNAGELPLGIEPITADLANPAALNTLPPALDVIVYAVGAQASGVEAYEAAYLDGPRHLIAALQAQGQRPGLFAYTSSTGVYSEAAGGLVDEDSETNPGSATSQVLVRAERQVLAGPFVPLVLRIAGIYGPGREGALRMIKQGRIMAGGEHYTNRIHRDDIVGAIMHLIGLSLAGRAEAIYNLADDAPTRAAEVTQWLARELGLEIVAAEGGGFNPGSKRVSNARLRNTGYALKHASFREGLASLERFGEIKQGLD